MISQDAIIAYRRSAGVGHGKRLYLRLKRLMDFICALLLVILLSPLFLLIALCVKLDSRGPVYFRQTRVGHNRRIGNRRSTRRHETSTLRERRSGADRRTQDLAGMPFGIYKFRSMYVNSEVSLHRRFVERFIKGQTAESGDGPNSGSLKFKLERDPRVTRVGRILRRTSLDELPQLFNVLKGEMSLVGPRPPIPYEVEQYEQWHKERLSVLPGITGLWQVRGRSQVSFDEMVRLDLHYVEHMSIALDVKILALTPWAALSGKGAA